MIELNITEKYILKIEKENIKLQQRLYNIIERLDNIIDELENAANEDYEYTDYNRGVNDTINKLLNKLKDLEENKYE